MAQQAHRNEEFERPVEVESPGTMALLEKETISTQISTAKKYPRSIQSFQRDLLTLVTADEETAKGCYYVLPRDGKKIEGPSVRMAEAAASCWSNGHFAARIVDIDDKFVTAQAVGWDLERNYRVGVEVRRRITNRYGQRYSDDMITVTANAAQAIAFRNCVLKIVPAALIRKAYNEVKQVSLGKGLTMEQRRGNAMKAFAKIGAKEAEVLRVVGRRGLDDITIDDLITLQGLLTAIQDGDTTWAEVLSSATPKTEADVEKDLETVLDKTADDLPEERTAPPAPETPPERQKISAKDAEDLADQAAALKLKRGVVNKILSEFGVDDWGDLYADQINEVANRLTHA